MRWLQAAALALMVALAIPARADDRAVKSKVAPVYPEIAKRMKISGVVKVEATVDAEGKVTDIKTLSGNRALSPAAEEAVRKWRFVPADAPSTVNVEVNFALAQ
jgi:TonB family protein